MYILKIHQEELKRAKDIYNRTLLKKLFSYWKADVTLRAKKDMLERKLRSFTLRAAFRRWSMNHAMYKKAYHNSALRLKRRYLLFWKNLRRIKKVGSLENLSKLIILALARSKESYESKTCYDGHQKVHEVLEDFVSYENTPKAFKRKTKGDDLAKMEKKDKPVWMPIKW